MLDKIMHLLAQAADKQLQIIYPCYTVTFKLI